MMQAVIERPSPFAEAYRFLNCDNGKYTILTEYNDRLTMQSLTSV